MSIVYSDGFESGVTDWGTATLGAGCSWGVEATSSIPVLITPPARWQDYALKVVSVGGLDAYNTISIAASALPITYWRFEFAGYSLGISGGEKFTLFRLVDGSGNPAVHCYWSRQAPPGSIHKLTLDCYHDGTSNSYESLTSPAQFSVHRLDLKWDATNDAWAWRLDGIDQPNDQDASDPVTSEGTLTGTHVTGIKSVYLGIMNTYDDDKGSTYYVDQLAVNNSTWPVPAIPRTQRLRRRVIVQVPILTKGAEGQDLATWATYLEQRAKVVPLAGVENFRLQQTVAEADHVILLRRAKGVTARHRALYPEEQTRLNGAVNNSVTTLRVHSASGFPTKGTYRIRVGSELMEVTAGQGTTTWTVTRGVDGTTKAAQTDGALIEHMRVLNIESAVPVDGRARWAELVGKEKV